MDHLSLSVWLRDRVKSEIDILRMSDDLNVSPSTVQKLLEGRPISRSIIRKIERALQEGRALDKDGKDRRPSTVERLMEVHHLYIVESSLRKVAKKLGLSRERVRQLLEKGSEIGLFEYKPSYPSPSSRDSPKG